MTDFYKSVLEVDRAAVVICNIKIQQILLIIIESIAEIIVTIIGILMEKYRWSVRKYQNHPEEL